MTPSQKIIQTLPKLWHFQVIVNLFVPCWFLRVIRSLYMCWYISGRAVKAWSRRSEPDTRRDPPELESETANLLRVSLKKDTMM